MLGLKMPETQTFKKPIFSNLPINNREKSNWLLHILFIRQEFD